VIQKSTKNYHNVTYIFVENMVFLVYHVNTLVQEFQYHIRVPWYLIFNIVSWQKVSTMVCF